jgi:hypothetical protein
MHLTRSTYLNIQVLEPAIYLEPNSLATSNVIHGTVNLYFPKAVAVKSLSVCFEGTMEYKSYCNTVKNIAHERLALYPSDNQQASTPFIVGAGSTQFGFEMQITSRLLESINCSWVKVYYYVTATVEYSTVRNAPFILLCSIPSKIRIATTTKKVKQPISIVRLPSYDTLIDASDAISSGTRTTDWITYRISVDKKTVPIGSQLPIAFNLTPVPGNDVFINNVSVQLIEECNIYHGYETRSSYSVKSIFPCKCNHSFIPKGKLIEPWEGTIFYEIPANQALVQSTQQYSEFYVKHVLLISIALHKQGNKKNTIMFQAHIDLLSKAVGDLESLKLPMYDTRPPPPFDSAENICKFAGALPPAYSDNIPTAINQH